MIELGNKAAKIAVCMLCAAFVGCSSHSESSTTFAETVPVPVVQEIQTAPGVVQYVWEEPMIDVVDVPPGLDPEGIYYRPAHQAILEIRQGRWRYPKEQPE